MPTASATPSQPAAFATLRRSMRSGATFLCAGLALAGTAASAASDADLTAMEQRWLQAGWPVILQAKALGLPLDIVVQPQNAPDLAPLAMGHVDGRCKLVYSMRGNRGAEETLDALPASLVPVVIEAMTAHEIGHCWRYAVGGWHALPAGFVGAEPKPAAHDAPKDASTGDAAARREEGFADLVALAWTRERHPQRYAEVHAWLTAVRDDRRVPGSEHDTRVWVRLAADPAALAGADDLFGQALRLWQTGLAAAP